MLLTFRKSSLLQVNGGSLNLSFPSAPSAPSGILAPDCFSPFVLRPFDFPRPLKTKRAWETSSADNLIGSCVARPKGWEAEGADKAVMPEAVQEAVSRRGSVRKASTLEMGS